MAHAQAAIDETKQALRSHDEDVDERLHHKRKVGSLTFCSLHLARRTYYAFSMSKVLWAVNTQSAERAANLELLELLVDQRRAKTVHPVAVLRHVALPPQGACCAVSVPLHVVRQHAVQLPAHLRQGTPISALGQLGQHQQPTQHPAR